MSDMSGLWPGSARVAPRTVMPANAFVPWARRLDVAPPPVFEEDEEELPAAPVIDPEAIALDGFARGFDEGRRTVEAELAQERAAVRRLAAALESSRPEPPAALAQLLAETVGRLVAQAVGEAGVDPDLLLARAQAAAAMVAEEARPARLRVHPDDAVRLGDAAPLPIVPDPLLMPGSVVVESRDGWIEDGPQVALDRLRAALDNLA